MPNLACSNSVETVAEIIEVMFWDFCNILEKGIYIGVKSQSVSR